MWPGPRRSCLFAGLGRRIGLGSGAQGIGGAEWRMRRAGSGDRDSVGFAVGGPLSRICLSRLCVLRARLVRARLLRARLLRADINGVVRGGNG
jgi:hypothetical protein